MEDLETKPPKKKYPPAVRFLFSAIALVVLFGLALGCGVLLNRFFSLFTEPEGLSQVQKFTAMGIFPGESAPDFSLLNLAGEEVTLKDYAGQPVLINFWATWCPPCEAEMPIFEAAQTKYQADNLVILGINVEEHPDTVRSFVDYHQLTFPILTDRERTVSDQYKLMAFPTSFLIDPNGNISYIHVGEMNEADLDRIIQALTENPWADF